jgi:glycosyltransferase involved in cell wall biosynthesis
MPPRSPSIRDQAPLINRSRSEAEPRPVVLQVVLTLDVGGTERLVVEICRRLHPRIVMAVCTLDAPGIWADELSSRGIKVVALNRQPGFRPSLALRLGQIASDCHARLVHCHHYSPFVYGSLATLIRPGLRMVFTEHGRLSDGPPLPKRQLVNPILGRLPDATVAVSSALRETMIAEGFPGGRVDVLHNGIDPGPSPTAVDRQARRRRFGLPEQGVVVGTIARLDPVKDLDTLIAAGALLRKTHPDLTLAIVGDGAERNNLEHAARRHGMADAIRFFGQRHDARALLSAFDVYVNSSISEGISLTILEAMAAGLAVVATRVGGTPEVVRDGETGLLVPPRSPAAIADAVKKLIDNPMWHRDLGAAGRRTVEERFTIDRMVDRYAEIYSRLAN